ncbi:MFS transporter [Rossellomorea vietnamensis]|uniref:MFS transporter n=1 Tax=Rossellomorea vietnamensis TaxID=218284 RepID=A0A5D4P0A5_9BACI|nr:MFS transporter [Rossellomorea vietnamensis]
MITLSYRNNLLLLGLGISTFGDFIYLVAINILVLQLTGSAAAVAGLWIIGPAASLLTKFWSGSLVDRINKRGLMILTDIVRALFIALIPFCESVLFIYIILFFLSVSKAFFEPASIAYITGLIPEAERKRFNSFRSLITSSAFLIGPAVSGVLILASSVEASIWINSISFLFSAAVLYLLPNVESGRDRAKITLAVLKEDWKAIYQFSFTHRYIAVVYFLSQFFMVAALAMDAQEVVFTRQILLLTEAEYGFLISITGIGSIVGASVVSAVSAKLSVRLLMNTGFLLVSAGYLFYAFSFSFWTAAAAFLVLGFFNPFWGTGFMTFYQNNVPFDLMGRFTSLFGVLQSILQIIFIMLIGFTGEVFPLRYSIIIASFLMLFVAVILIGLINRPTTSFYYAEKGEKSIDQ